MRNNLDDRRQLFRLWQADFFLLGVFVIPSLADERNNPKGFVKR